MERCSITLASPLHTPVLKDEVVRLLVTDPGGVYVDCTVGGGGHAQAVLEGLSPSGRLIGLDIDPAALSMAAQRLTPYGSRAILFRANFTQLDDYLATEGVEQVDGILFDLGVSSMHVDTPERGFSYLQDGPLDMRMNPSEEKSAWEVVNLYPEGELVRIFRKYGEERFSWTIAKAIVKARALRPIESTGELVETIRRTIPKKGQQKRLARSFQAIRIEVNRELDNLRVALPKAIECLKLGGRIGVISYHSLEDRLVKTIFSQKAKGCTCSPELPECVCGGQRELKLITKRAYRPSAAEVAVNRRARSARLRVAERIVP